MDNLLIDDVKKEQAFRDIKINSIDKKIIEEFISEPKKNIVYTSFNGDYINYIYNICNYEIGRGNIPLNPELGLGYLHIYNIIRWNKAKGNGRLFNFGNVI